MQTFIAWRRLFGPGLMFSALCCSIIAAAEPRIDVAKLKPGDKLEYQTRPGEWEAVTYVRSGPANTLLIERPPFRQPVPAPINWLRIPEQKPNAAGGGTSGQGERAAALKPRVWSDRSGKFSINATIVRVEEGKAILKRSADQIEVAVPFEKLSEADQKYISDYQAESTKNNAGGSDQSARGASEPNDTPLVPTNLSRAHLVDASRGEWLYHAEPADLEKLPPLQVTLPEVRTFEKPIRVLLSPKEKRAYVVYLYSKPGADALCTVQACNLITAKLEPPASFGTNETPIAISSDGSLVLSRSVFSLRSKQDEGTLRLYSHEGDKVKALSAWRPFNRDFGPGEIKDNPFEVDVLWAAFGGPTRLVTINRSGTRLAVWEVPDLKLLYAINLEAGLPSLSASGGHLSLVSKAAVSIVNVADGAVVARIPINGDSSFATAALSDNGERLAVWQSGRIRVWNLKAKEIYRDFGLLVAETGHPGRLEWISDNDLLLDGSAVVDIERRVPIAQFGGARESAYYAATSWFVREDLPTAYKRTGLLVLVGTPLAKQQMESITRYKPEELLVLQPGSEVAIDVNGSGAEETADIKQALESNLKKNGMNVVRDSRLRLVCTTQSGAPKTIRYRSMRDPFGAGQEYQVAVLERSLQLNMNGKELWGIQQTTVPPETLWLTEGQTVEDALQQAAKNQQDYFPKLCANIWIPAYLARLPSGFNEQPQLPQKKAPPK